MSKLEQKKLILSKKNFFLSKKN